ncbi:hypothetical protein ACFVRD_40205 [Streptomyces sp. NPDC057908]|uniref:hypothetical protein n=1 Tax=Streptomyces sp. NPDC057908 TaxID=3346276 RepID=UPI0036E449BA
MDPAALRKFDGLTVSHARRLSGVGAVENLRFLILAGCDLGSLDEVDGLRGLGTLAVSDTVIGSVQSLAHLDVHTVTAERSELLDISPLLQCQGLVEVSLKGTALSDESYRSVIPELIARGCAVYLPSDLERELMTKMRENGIPFSYYQSRKGYRLCRPGLKYTETPEVNHPVISPDELQRMLLSAPESIWHLFSESI